MRVVDVVGVIVGKGKCGSVRAAAVVVTLASEVLVVFSLRGWEGLVEWSSMLIAARHDGVGVRLLAGGCVGGG